MNVNTKLKYTSRIAKVIINNDSEPTITIQFQDNQEIKIISKRVASSLEIIITPEDEAIAGLLNLRKVNLTAKSIYQHIRTRDLIYLHTVEDGIVKFYKVEKIKTKSNGTIYDMIIDNESFAQLSSYSFAESYILKQI
jgi:hypothetical protein